MDKSEMPSPEQIQKYLHGYCINFANALNDVYGYPIEQLWFSDKRLCHAYCIFDVQDIRYFIDIRGKTTDWHEFIKPFVNEIGADPGVFNPYEYEDLPITTIYEPRLLYKMEEEETQEAKKIIEKNMRRRSTRWRVIPER